MTDSQQPDHSAEPPKARLSGGPAEPDLPELPDLPPPPAPGWADESALDPPGPPGALWGRDTTPPPLWDEEGPPPPQWSSEVTHTDPLPAPQWGGNAAPPSPQWGQDAPPPAPWGEGTAPPQWESAAPGGAAQPPPPQRSSGGSTPPADAWGQGPWAQFPPEVPPAPRAAPEQPVPEQAAPQFRPPQFAPATGRHAAESPARTSPRPYEPYEPYEPWRLERPPRRGRRVPLRPLFIGAAGLTAVAAVAAVGIAALGGEDEDPAVTAGAVLAADRFAADPAAADGRDQQFTDVAAVGSTVVAAGEDVGLRGAQGRLLVSADSGRSFRLAAVRGGAPSDLPRLVAGSAKGWVAIGRRPAGTVLWVSGDGRTWERLPSQAAGAFQQQDRVNEVLATPSGFIAVGAQSAKGDFTDARPIVWLSRDGRAWERLTADRLRMDHGDDAMTLLDVVTDGRVLLASARRTKDPGSARAVNSGSVWRSEDGGRTWEIVRIPAPRGSSGLAIGGGATGLLALREIRDGEESHAQIYSSTDGESWDEAGKIEVSGYQRVRWLLSSEQGHVALALADGKAVVLTSRDGRDWQETGDFPLTDKSLPLAAATAQGRTFVVGADRSGGDSDGLLAVHAGQGIAGPVDLSRVSGAVLRDQAVTGVTATGSLALAVGGTGGDAAVWTSPDGTNWRRAGLSRDLSPRAGAQRLAAAASGGRGWLAVGLDGVRPRAPLVLTSGDGASWQALDDKVFRPAGDSWLAATGTAAAGPGYVIVGEDGTSAATWFSADLKTWERGEGAGKNDLDADGSAGRWMRAVTGGPFGFVAVGGLLDAASGGPRRTPAVWSSADGRNWALQRLRLPQGVATGTVEKITATGQRLVAVGEGDIPGKGTVPLAFVSVDGGANWRSVALPVPSGGVEVRPTAVTATARGFAAAGVTGRPANLDVVLWSSADGSTWKVEKPGGTGLSGDGDQWIDALTTFRGELLGVGTTTGPEGEQPTLWRRPLP